MMGTVSERVRLWLENPDSSQLTGGGAVLSLENKLVNYYGKRYALCVANATLGLWATLKAAGLERKDVICPSLTWGGSVSGALLLHNRIHLADIDSGSLCIAAESVEVLARRSGARAVVAVDLGGNPHRTEALREVCNKHGLFYLSDAAQSLGATLCGKPAGLSADAVVVSFGTRKTVGAGEGAAILTDDRNLYEKLVWLTQHPLRQQKDIGFEAFNEFSMNGRIHPLSAIIADALFEERIAQAGNTSVEIERRLRLLEQEGLIDYPLPESATSSWYYITATRLCAVKPNRMARFLKANLPDWLACGCSLRPLHRQPFFKAYQQQFRTILPNNAEEILRKTVQFYKHEQ